MTDPKRGTSRTTRLIRNAPFDAFFVCQTGAAIPTRRLCASLGRRDLRVHTLADYERGILNGYAGAIVFDHTVDPANDEPADAFAALVSEAAAADRAHATASAALDAANAAFCGTRAKAYEAKCALNEYVAARVTAAGGAESL